MKTLKVFLFFIVISVPVFSQLTEQCKTVKLGSKEELQTAEVCIDQLADFVLSKPLRDDEAHKARVIILAWMEKTPNFTFSINANLLKVCKGENILLFGIYMTSMAKAALLGNEEFNEEALKIFMDYIKIPENDVAKTKEIEKLLTSWDKMDYDKYVR